MLKLKLNPDKETPAPASPGQPVKEESEAPSEKSGSENGMKLSFNLGAPKAPKIKVKTSRAHTEGYDAEAPDREEDPTIEDAIVLRMIPGVGLENLHKAVEKNDFSGIQVKFEDTRRAIVTVADEKYAAQLVDLPTITEIHKTFDRKNIYKGPDIAQMLLVTKRISDDGELDSIAWQDHQYQHGLTPPLHNVRNRRFHKRLSNKVIESLEAKVDELFRKDNEAQETRYELLPADAVATQQAYTAAMLGVSDANDDDEDDEDDMALELAKAFDEQNAAQDNSEASEASAGSDDEDDDDDDDLDEDQQDSRNHNKLLKDEIRDLEATIEAKEKDAESTVNQIMKGRLIDVVNRMRKELDMKKGLLQDVEDQENERAQANEDEDVVAKPGDEAEEDEEAEEDDDVESLF